MRGENALTVTWPLDDGRALQLDANLSDDPAPWHDASKSQCIYATSDIDGCDRRLPPWSVVWRIDEARTERENVR